MGARKHQGAEEPLGKLLPARQPQLQLAAAARTAACAGLRGDPRVVPPQGVESLGAILAAGGPRLPGVRLPPPLAAAARAHAAYLARQGDMGSDSVVGGASGLQTAHRIPQREQRSAESSTGTRHMPPT